MIGRSDDCQIKIPERWVSRQHARIILTDQQTYWVSDLNSSNGTFVNGQRVRSPIQLYHGDRIVIGRTELRFQYKAALTTQVAIVLLLQSQPRQSQIWAELLSTQGLSVFPLPLNPEESFTEFLEHWLRKMQQPPNLLLLDINAIQLHPQTICQWCQTLKPPLKVVLTDASRTSIAVIEQEQAIAEGAVGLIPALPETALLYHAPTIRKQVSTVLQVMESQLIEEDAFASALLLLESELPGPVQPTASLSEYFQS